MGGTSTQQQTSQSKTEPWAPTQGILKDILGGIQGQVQNFQPTGAETGALNTIMSNAQGAQNYGPQATQFANDLMGGGTDRTGILSGAYNQMQGALSPYLSQSYLDPTQSPGMQSVLDTIRGDVSNSVNGLFAGAGRDLSGAHVQNLSRGLSQGLAAPLLNQYNQNVAAQQGAAGQLFGAGGQTAQGLSALDQTALGNRAQGFDIGINGVPQAQNAGAMGVLNASNMSRGLPLQNLGLLEALTLPIAGLGGQTSGTATGSKTMSPAEQAWGWGKFATGLFG